MGKKKTAKKKTPETPEVAAMLAVVPLMKRYGKDCKGILRSVNELVALSGGWKEARRVLYVVSG